MDTKYLMQALTEWMCSRSAAWQNPEMRLGDIPIRHLSAMLQRAQELKDADLSQKKETL